MNSNGADGFPLIRELNSPIYVGRSLARIVGSLDMCFPTISSWLYPDILKKAVLHEVMNPFKFAVIIPSGANSTMFLYFSSDSLNWISAFFRSVMSCAMTCSPVVLPSFFMKAT